MLLFGALAAVLMSLVGLVGWSDPYESNSLPLVGLHVLINDLPANPTTWYIGTYLHLLVVWVVVMRGVRVRPWMIGATLGGEILIRAFIIDVREPFVAYMLVSNWLLVFLVGLAAGQREPSPLTAIPVSRVVLPALLLWIAWPVSMAVPSWRLTFPFMSLALDAPWPTALLLSGAVSFLYTGYALTGWGGSHTAAASSFAAFLARNSAFVFIAHMPVYYVLKDVWLPVIPSYAVRVAIEFAICLPGLALCSEAIRGALKPADLRGVDGRESKGGSPGDRCPRRGDGRVGGEGFVP